MRNSDLTLIEVIRSGRNHEVKVKCNLCGQTWVMWRSHYYRGDTPCDCKHWAKNNPRLYSIYSNMKTRCYNDANPNYKNYGKRGIIMCDEWKNSFLVFRKWAMSHGYKDDLTIERIDVNGNYEPSNCTWITPMQQASNKTNTIRFNGTSLRNFCSQYGINYKLVHQYWKRHPKYQIEQVIRWYLNKKLLEVLKHGKTSNI